jgi:hypothetical protein
MISRGGRVDDVPNVDAREVVFADHEARPDFVDNEFYSLPTALVGTRLFLIRFTAAHRVGYALECVGRLSGRFTVELKRRGGMAALQKAVSYLRERFRPAR